MFYLIVVLLFHFVFSSNLIAESEQTAIPVFQQASPLEIFEDEGFLLENLECKKFLDKDKKELLENLTIDQFEPTLSAECEPLTTVAGCVNVISGSFFQVDRDLTGATIDPLDFIRYYDSGSDGESFLGFGFGSGFPLWATGVEKGARHNYGLISERDDFTLIIYINI